jgi:DNA-binding transcriptional LysR family regulator
MDVVIRIGEPRDSNLTMRKLIDNRRIIVAAPDYLRRRGTPTTQRNWSGTTACFSAAAPARSGGSSMLTVALPMSA